MFVFRNYTVENLFAGDTLFSGYGDISFVPKDEKELVWLYQAPISFDPVAKAAEIHGFLDKLEFVAGNLGGDSTLFVCELMDLFPVCSVDADDNVRSAIRDFNEGAARLAKSAGNIRYVALQEYFSRFPAEDLINWKFYFFSQMIVSPVVAKGFADWLERRLSQIRGARKKCLVLDLDNTLWGGVLGEDGIEGIKIGGDYPGNAFLYFQEALIELSRQGVILTVCSKNNEKDVIEAWEKNPFIKLNKNYISAYRINWNNKADNIRELAKELNIGLDSMVFVDDNPTERELVKQQLPMVTVPDFPKQPYRLMDLYKNLAEDYFRVYELTDEDKKKTEQYKANAQRAAESNKFTDLTDFIKSLDIELDIYPADEFNIPRIAQMTQKTNQFNLTTRRYTETDIASFVKIGDPVYCLSVKDKFGDNGITGAIILKKTDEPDTLGIDSLLLSCRILGKGIEEAFLKTVLNVVNEKGYQKVISMYIPTAKNGQVADFYDRMGFTLVNSHDGGVEYEFELGPKLEVAGWYKCVVH